MVLFEQLTLSLPIIQAPMAGGISTPELVAEVSNHGGLGSLPLAYLTLEEARKVIGLTKTLTKKPFAVNIFIPDASPIPDASTQKTMLTYINALHDKLDLPKLAALPQSNEPSLNELIELILVEEIPVVSFTFGVLPKKQANHLQKKGVLMIGTATTVQEGLALEANGCHAVVAQGFEAGGHRGGFLEKKLSTIGSMALIPAMVDRLSIPVIAAGGIMDGRGIVAALALGAKAAALGTAFIACHESGASSFYKEELSQHAAEDTVLTLAFTGKWVRALQNRFISTTEEAFFPDRILPYPMQHYLTRAFRSKANQTRTPDYASIWSGQGIPLRRFLSVKEFMRALSNEMKSGITSLGKHL